MLERVCVHARASKYIDVRIVWLQVKMAQVNLIGACKTGTGKTGTGDKRTSKVAFIPLLKNVPSLS